MSNIQTIIEILRKTRLDQDETTEVLRAVRDASGYSKFGFSVKRLNLERVDPGREKREKFPPAEYHRLYGVQQGHCTGYKVPRHPFEGPARDQEIDHIDPHANPFNAKRNRQLLCPDCNGRKSADSVADQSKKTGRMFTELIQPGLEAEEL